MEPVILALEEKYDREITFIIADLSDPETEKLLEIFSVRYIPAFFYIDRNGNIQASDAGSKTFSQLEEGIKKYLLEGN